MRLFILSLFMIIHAIPGFAQEKGKYYLKWNTDHTERKIEPEFLISDADYNQHKVYYIERDREGRLETIKFFFYGKPSNAADFGAHELRILYFNEKVVRQYFNVEGQRVSGGAGAYAEIYQLDSSGFYTRKSYLNAAGEKIADKYGVADYQILSRDSQGRRVSERHINLSGDVIPDRYNDFLETRFTYDKNDHLKTRAAYDLQGNRALGGGGYHTAYFWFDKKANFNKEEFRNLEEALVVPNDIHFAKIEFNNIDDFGRIQEVRYYGPDNQLLKDNPAISVLSYDALGRIIKRTYHSPDMELMNNNRGVATYVYSYKEDKTLNLRQGFDHKGVLIP
ncbi:hypothetical protein QGN29_09260 [Temperatibacter marinus]|uniref:Uncharacterized protein n=1 Tax=Temperatibacter marinus TaxID=1456591 RepID=A0AA52EBM3_9PROT|nr:hypothetical protein [Temperatibacter marinus]WND01740.1 hypothetical protein QGN29_09260 [Temperatibacter marinus]